VVTLGKAARNEQRKLRATLFNNIAIGLFVVGVAVPLLTVYRAGETITELFLLPEKSAAEVAGTIVAFVTAVCLGYASHQTALHIAAKIED
jgi:hypothetical protein